MALYDCMVSMHEYAVQCYTLSGGKEMPVQTGHDLPQSTVYGVFAARDGYIVIAAQVDDAWKRLAEADRRRCARGRCALSQRPGRNEHRLEILPSSARGRWRSRRSSASPRSTRSEVPCAKVQRIDEVLADPQIVARGMLVEQDHPVLGKVRLPNLPFRFSECDTTPKSVAPLMGQHNREIAAKLGYLDRPRSTRWSRTACSTPKRRSRGRPAEVGAAM